VALGVPGASGISLSSGSRATNESGEDGRLSYVSGPPTDEVVENMDENDSSCVGLGRAEPLVVAVGSSGVLLAATVMVGIAGSVSPAPGCTGAVASVVVVAGGEGLGSPPEPLMTADAVETVLSAALSVENGGGLDVRRRQPLAVSLRACRGFGEGERLLGWVSEFLLTDRDEGFCEVEPEDGAGGVSAVFAGVTEWASSVEGPGSGPAEADSSAAAVLASLFFFFSSASLRCCSS